jgi:DNA-binding transcriptional LysR family regulator
VPKDLPEPITQINLRLLQTFMLVAENQSFREAAEQTHRSQSAVSTQIKQLESQLGVSLLHRTTRSVELTPEGRELLASTKRAMNEVTIGLRKVKESADFKRGRVSLACSPSVATTQLPDILRTFHEVHPRVQINLLEQHSADIHQTIREARADFGIGPRVEAIGEDIVFEPILNDPIMALVPRKFLPNPRKAITLDELVAMPLVLHTPGTAMRRLFEKAIAERELVFESSYQCMQMQSLVAMAVAGMGAAVLPLSVIKEVHSPSTQALRLTEPGLSREVCIITLRGHVMSPTASRFAQLVRDQIDRGGKLGPHGTDMSSIKKTKESAKKF